VAQRIEREKDTSAGPATRAETGLFQRGIQRPRYAAKLALSFPENLAVGGVFFLPPAISTENQMARGDVRIAATLECQECKRRNYQTQKSKRNNPDRIELRKYCRWCKTHTAHKETR